MSSLATLSARAFPAGNDPGVNTYTRIGGFLFTVMLASLIGRFPELLARTFGTSLSHLLILLLICLPLVPMSGGIRRLTKERMFWALFLLQVWYTVALPFSSWRSGSLLGYTFQLRTAPLFLFAVAFIVTLPQLRGIFYAAGIGMVFGLGQILSSGKLSDDSRIQLEEGSFANSNEIATYLIIFMPFLLYLVLRPKFNIIWKLAAIGVIFVSIGESLKTGSRAGLILLSITGVLLFARLSLANKVRVLLPTLGIAVFLFVSLPAATKTRLMSLFDEDAAANTSALASKLSRTALLMESIDISIRYPIFGIGFNVYHAVAADKRSDPNSRRLYQTTHNSYTQVSAENGMPALICFLTAFAFAFGYIRDTRKIAGKHPQLAELKLMADCLFLSLISVVVSGFFGNNAYHYPTYVVLTLGVPLHAIAVREAAALASGAVAAPQPRMMENRFTKPAAPVQTASNTTIDTAAEVEADPAGQYGNVPWKVSPRKAARSGDAKPPVALR